MDDMYFLLIVMRSRYCRKGEDCLYNIDLTTSLVRHSYEGAAAGRECLANPAYSAAVHMQGS